MKVSMPGLGIMGAGMAGQIVAKGFEVSVWNRNPAKSTQLGNLGARVAASPADAARGADLVFAMLADDDASRGVWLGAEARSPSNGCANSRPPQVRVASDSSTRR